MIKNTIVNDIENLVIEFKDAKLQVWKHTAPIAKRIKEYIEEQDTIIKEVMELLKIDG